MKWARTIYHYMCVCVCVWWSEQELFTTLCVCVCVCVQSCPTLSVTPWTVTHQAPQSMGFPGQEYWSGLSLPPPEDLPSWSRDPDPISCIAGRFSSTAPLGKPWAVAIGHYNQGQRGWDCVKLSSFFAALYWEAAFSQHILTVDVYLISITTKRAY